MPTRHDLQTYLDELVGGVGELSPPAKPVRGLPAYLARTYELCEGRLFGRELLFALRKAAASEGLTPARLVADFEALVRAAPGALVVLVLDDLPSYQRRRLLAAAVPFVVPRRQVFLPTMIIDLHERQPARPDSRIGHLGWAAQVALLRHLLHGDVEERNLAGVAEVCGYTAMAISKAQRQLVALDLAGLRMRARSKHLEFVAQGPDLWQRALPFLRRPWHKRVSVTATGARPRCWIAGVDALALESTLAAGSVPTVAMTAADLRVAIADESLVTCPAEDEADLIVEAWNYDPGRLAEGDVVDPLSLDLCLRDDPDERVQIALEKHRNALEW